MNEVTQELLKELFDYCPNTGVLFVKKYKRGGKRIGKEAGTFDKHGYVQICINYKIYFRHHLIWFYHYGRWPKTNLDHENRRPGDDRIENLRENDRSQSRFNSEKSVNNGRPKGVYIARNGRFISKITVRGRIIHLGTYDTTIEAGAAYVAASKRFHGEHSPYKDV